MASAAHPTSPAGDTWVSVALTYPGLKALGVPQDSLDSFAWEFRQGMAARATALGDTGESSPEHWEQPLGTRDVHVVADGARARPARGSRRRSRARARPTRDLPGVDADLAAGLPRAAHRAGSRSDSGTASAIRPSKAAAFPARNPREPPLKAGEFVLGYLDETGGLPPMPQPDVLGRNGTYVAFRKLHQRVAAFRRYLSEQRARAATTRSCWRRR